MTERFDVECPDCGCKFVKNEKWVQYYCPNCQEWRPISYLIPIKKK